MKNLTLASIFIFYTIVLNGQSNSDEVQRLQQRIKEKDLMIAQAEARAIKAEAHAKKLRYIAQSKALAEIVSEIQDKELAGLLAVQAYNFNVQYEGNPFNGTIYHSLVNALKKYDLISHSSKTNSLLNNTNTNEIFSAVLPNSRSYVNADQNGNLRIVTEKGETLRTLLGHRAQVDQIKFSNSGILMATSGKDNTIRIWNLTQLNQRPLVIMEREQISNLTFSSDDLQIIYSVGSKNVIVNQMPLDTKLIAESLCKVLGRNLTKDEWNIYVGDDLPYEQTCSKWPPNNK